MKGKGEVGMERGDGMKMEWWRR